MGVSLVAFTVLFIALLLYRERLMAAEEQLNALESAQEDFDA